MSVAIKRGDWVKTRSSDLIGFVKRLAADGSWADVDWHTGVKRMPTRHLQVQTTIPLGDGVTVTDLDRERELAQQDERTTDKEGEK